MRVRSRAHHTGRAALPQDLGLTLPPALETRGARKRLVRQQLINRGIDDRRVLAVMAWLPREWFLPPKLAHEAYHDRPLPIGSGQTISQPYVVALMTALLALHRAHRVLEIGTGSGYQTAVLARLVQRVCTIERLPDLLVEAEARLGRLGIRNVDTRLGDGAAGWPEAAPFDAILVTAATPRVPAPLLDQLAPGGRLVAPVGDPIEQELVILERRPERWVERSGGGVRFVPLVSPLAFPDDGA